MQPLWGPAVEEPPPPSEPEPAESPVILRKTPELFAHPHVRASFAPGGMLVVVLPHNLRAFQRAEVELSHVTESVRDAELVGFVEAVSEFPGPLMPGETPKSVVVGYASSKAEQCRTRQQVEEGEEGDAEAAKELHDEALLWDFLVLLCQQNGVVVASDISELLTREKPTSVIPARTHVGGGDQEDGLESVRQLLIAGRKRDALEQACSRCLWGHALMLASKMDEQSRTYVINRFTASLVTTDPLSTFYTLMLGRTPSAVKPDGLRRAGSWRPHLAMILANRSSKLDNASIVTLGDSLLENGRLCAAHFCYHLADVQFGAYGNVGSKYLLLGVQNSLLKVGLFPRPEYVRKMEVFEYAMSLGKQEFVLPHFQVFKYLLALQLTQVGMVAKAFKYCEQIATVVAKSPGKFPPTLLHSLDELSTQLHHLNHPHGVVETKLPSWLLQLQQTLSDVLAGNYVASARSTPSPTFSSISQTYGGQQTAQPIFGRAGQYLRVPGGNGYKGSSVDTSTAASSKEGSVVGVPTTQATAVAAISSEQDHYQPSPLAQQQQVAGLSQPQEQLLKQDQYTSDAAYSQNPSTSGQAPVMEGNPAISSGPVAYYDPTQSQGKFVDGYASAAGASGGDVNLQSLAPSSSSTEQQQQQPVQAVTDSAVPGGYGEYGTSNTTLPDQQQPPPPQTDQEQQMYTYNPSDAQQQQQFYQGVQGYENQQQGMPATESQTQQFGYEQPLQPATDSTQGYGYEQSTQPAEGVSGAPPTSEPAYGSAGYWDQQYPPTSAVGGQYDGGGSGGGNEGVAPAVTGQSGDDGRQARKQKQEEEEEKETEKKKESKKDAGEKGINI